LLTELTTIELCLVTLGALGIGMTKSGLAGIGMLHVVVFSYVFGARAGTGVLLPLLIVGDVLAVRLVGQEVQWRLVVKLLPPALIGVVAGWILLDRLDESALRPTVGAIILTLTVIQTLRLWRPHLFQRFPHSRWFAWSLGILAGVTTMMANAAGPVIALYLLAISLPKYQLIATSAWFFLVLNCIKVPFSYQLGLIDSSSLALNAVFAPAVLAGLLIGRFIVRRLQQRLFDSLLLMFTGIAALRLMFNW
jgi:uncharacterized protein